MLLHSFQDKELKLHRNVEDSTGKVVYGLMMLPYLRRGQTGRVNHSEKCSKCSLETSQLRQPLPGTGRRQVDDSTVSPEGSEMKG